MLGLYNRTYGYDRFIEQKLLEQLPKIDVRQRCRIKNCLWKLFKLTTWPHFHCPSYEQSVVYNSIVRHIFDASIAQTFEFIHHWGYHPIFSCCATLLDDYCRRVSQFGNPLAVSNQISHKNPFKVVKINGIQPFSSSLRQKVGV